MQQGPTVAGKRIDEVTQNLKSETAYEGETCHRGDVRRLHELAQRVSYGGNPEHKRDPGDFGLNPPRCRGKVTNMRCRAIVCLTTLTICVCNIAVANGSVKSRVQQLPFVGCPVIGQASTQPSFSAPPVALKAAPAIASRIAFYGVSAEEFEPSAGSFSGLFAPRGWHCLAAVGSARFYLVVSSIPLGDESPIDVAAPAIEISLTNGEGSGRFDVVNIASKLFPKLMASFIRNVQNEGIGLIEPVTTKDDTLHRIGTNVVEFRTPPFKPGLGTTAEFVPSAEPINGVISVAPSTGNMREVFVRLSNADRPLAQILLRLDGTY